MLTRAGVWAESPEVSPSCFSPPPSARGLSKRSSLGRVPGKTERSPCVRGGSVHPAIAREFLDEIADHFLGIAE